MIGHEFKDILHSSLKKSPHELGMSQKWLNIDDGIKISLIHTVISIKRERRMSRANLKVLAVESSSPTERKEGFDEKKD